MNMNTITMEASTISTKAVGPRVYALTVIGDSMGSPKSRPSYPDGSVIVVDLYEPIVSGACVVARLEGAQATFRQYLEDGSKRYLKPLNPRYPIIEIAGDVTFYGVAVQVMCDC